jgi:signal transduction histidine kinase
MRGFRLAPARTTSGSVATLHNLGVELVRYTLDWRQVEPEIRALERWTTAAELREQEYRRALVDYRRLIRHRLANPTTTIIGAKYALNDLPTEPQTGRELLEIIQREAMRLESIGLDPHQLAPEEHGLHPEPTPRLDQPTYAGT